MRITTATNNNTFAHSQSRNKGHGLARRWTQRFNIVHRLHHCFFDHVVGPLPQKSPKARNKLLVKHLRHRRSELTLEQSEQEGGGVEMLDPPLEGLSCFQQIGDQNPLDRIRIRSGTRDGVHRCDLLTPLRCVVGIALNVLLGMAVKKIKFLVVIVVEDGHLRIESPFASLVNPPWVGHRVQLAARRRRNLSIAPFLFLMGFSHRVHLGPDLPERFAHLLPKLAHAALLLLRCGGNHIRLPPQINSSRSSERNRFAILIVGPNGDAGLAGL
mmetsp:Transcript_97707/g.260847  ORF Transcript_97707/g.260847 Transcript_97707/m.260847 type:complete len:271 (-) Transcript_97707:36-848(-)